MTNDTEPTQWQRDLTRAMLLDDPKLWQQLWNRAPVSPIIRAVVNRLDRGAGYQTGPEQFVYTKLFMQQLPTANTTDLWKRYEHWIRCVLRHNTSYLANETRRWLDEVKREQRVLEDSVFGVEEAACAMETIAVVLSKEGVQEHPWRGWRTLRNKLLALLQQSV